MPARSWPRCGRRNWPGGPPRRCGRFSKATGTTSWCRCRRRSEMGFVTGLVIVITIYVYGLCLLSSRVRPEKAGSSDDRFFFVLLVPALNEEAVIGRTIGSLLALHGNFLALVIDD